MAGQFDNIHPSLSFEKALGILATPEEDLDLSSDYYMAVCHLLNFPGDRTEDALLNIASNESDTQAIRLARRKSLEILGRLGCSRALPVLARCLDDSDPYLVENAVWSLLQIGSNDPEVHQRLMDLLVENQSNQRIIIQCLAGLDVQDAVDVIQQCLKSPTDSVRTAAGSALCRLTGDRGYLDALEPLLFSVSQMDRQMVIEDLADCGGIELLDSILKSPVSPVFRLRFVQAVLPPLETSLTAKWNLLDVLDQILTDSPDSLLLRQTLDKEMSTSEYLEGLFSNDFARCYQCLLYLSGVDGSKLGPLLLQQWNDRAFNDYGAHYFFVRLIGLVSSWPDDMISILEKLLLEAVDNLRPQFSKSRPAALLSLLNLSSKQLSSHFLIDILESSNSSWQLQYAALMVAEQLPEREQLILHQHLGAEGHLSAAHAYVRKKLSRVLA